jgi:UreD urease accessory protein
VAVPDLTELAFHSSSHGMSPVPPPIPAINAGVGRIVLHSSALGVGFSELSATYPLKLLSPRIGQDGVAIVYMLSYGGGLVAGDSIKLFVDVGPGGILMLLSQVSFLTGSERLLTLSNTGLYESLQNSARR